MIDKMTCPLCNRRLKLKQINLTEAVYLCTDLTCSYPINNQCYIVKRNLENLQKISKYSTISTVSNSNSPHGNITDVDNDLDIDELVSETLTNLNYSRENVYNNLDTKKFETSVGKIENTTYDADLEEFINGLTN
ncbi:uncharacterized protein LOC130440454 [Diorhabda sublineata]|uniref:uncharacterized protein LOC130440454 n=1 Tax=Diorhabda sublineata TaxID=1163346 RepID=UPI0024E054EE|nr:uncharacterized protein LOC130440454 [Diorhabda sublineata]